MEKRIPCLCGGSVFNLLLTARKPRTKIRNRDIKHTDNSNDHLGIPNVMGGLIKVVTGVNPDPDGKTIGTDTTRYRTCQSNGSALIPFDPETDETVISGFVKTAKKENSVILERMTEFCETYLNIENAGTRDELVQKLLDIIAHDSFSDVPDSTEFYPLFGNDTPVAKDDLLLTESFELEPFLIGILLWLFTSGRNNTIEKDTYESWLIHTSARAEWKLRKDLGLGDGIQHPVHAAMHDYSGAPAQPKDASEEEPGPKAESEKSDHEVLTDALMRSAKVIADGFGRAEHQLAEQIREKQKESDSSDAETEYAEAEVEEDHDESSGAADEGKKITIIQQQTNVVQNGDHNVNVTNNGTMNFNF